MLVLALRRVQDLKPDSVITMGTGDRRRQIKLKTIYVALGAGRAAALPGFHALTGSDTTGHIKGKGKSSCFKVFLKAGEDVICALAGLCTELCKCEEAEDSCNNVAMSQNPSDDEENEEEEMEDLDD